MTIQELNSKFDNIIKNLHGDKLGEIMAVIGESAVTKIRERILKTGVDAEGQKYTPYSTKPMLSGCSNLNVSVCERLIGSKPKRENKKWVTIDKINKKTGKKIHLFEIPGGYKELRELHGRQTGFVDFAFSGRMWQNIKLIKDQSDLNRGIAIIRATTPEDEKKLAGNTKRRTDILKLSKGELSELSGIFNNRVAQIIHSEGL